MGQANQKGNKRIGRVYPGAGYRLLRKGEIIRTGDQFKYSFSPVDNPEWTNSCGKGKAGENGLIYRRRITSGERALSNLPA